MTLSEPTADPVLSVENYDPVADLLDVARILRLQANRIEKAARSVTLGSRLGSASSPPLDLTMSTITALPGEVVSVDLPVVLPVPLDFSNLDFESFILGMGDADVVLEPVELQGQGVREGKGGESLTQEGQANSVREEGRRSREKEPKNQKSAEKEQHKKLNPREDGAREGRHERKEMELGDQCGKARREEDKVREMLRQRNEEFWQKKDAERRKRELKSKEERDKRWKAEDSRRRNGGVKREEAERQRIEDDEYRRRKEEREAQQKREDEEYGRRRKEREAKLSVRK
jgi:hypothetical protein